MLKESYIIIALFALTGYKEFPFLFYFHNLSPFLTSEYYSHLTSLSFALSLSLQFAHSALSVSISLFISYLRLTRFLLFRLPPSPALAHSHSLLHSLSLISFCPSSVRLPVSSLSLPPSSLPLHPSPFLPPLPPYFSSPAASSSTFLRFHCHPVSLIFSPFPSSPSLMHTSTTYSHVSSSHPYILHILFSSSSQYFPYLISFLNLNLATLSSFHFSLRYLGVLNVPISVKGVLYIS